MTLTSPPDAPPGEVPLLSDPLGKDKTARTRLTARRVEINYIPGTRRMAYETEKAREDLEAAARRTGGRVGGMARETPGKVRRDAPKLWQRMPAAGWVAIGIAATIVLVIAIAA